MQKHGSISGNSAKRSHTITTYSDGAIRSTTIARMEDVGFLKVSLSPLAIRRVRLLESWSIVILDIDPTTRIVGLILSVGLRSSIGSRSKSRVLSFLHLGLKLWFGL